MQRYNSDISLDGKVALVTGAGAGIGREIALTYAALGAAIVVAEIDADRCAAVTAELDALDVPHVVRTVDVRSTEAVALLIDEVRERFGRIDILVNNVGDFFRLRGPFESFAEEDWDALYAINLRHVFVVTRAALPLMRASGEGGSIIVLSSIEGYRGAPPAAVYAAFKAALTGFTKSLALELGPENIRVNIIAPETTETPQVPIHAMIPEHLRDHEERWIPMGRFGTPRDCAGCAVFLATPLSGWVTGTTIHVGGGALAAGGFYRAPDGSWTNTPVISDVAGWGSVKS